MPRKSALPPPPAATTPISLIGTPAADGLLAQRFDFVRRHARQNLIVIAAGN